MGYVPQPDTRHETVATSPHGDFLTARMTLLATLGAITSFHLAYTFGSLSFLIIIYLFCLFLLARVKSTRIAFYLGMFIGLATFAPKLAFFFKIFGPGAIALWLVGGVWIAAFLLTARSCVGVLGWKGSIAVVPFLWTGWEYFRSELNPLRFSWLNVGSTFSGSPGHIGLDWFGMYGIGFIFMCLIAAGWFMTRRLRFLFWSVVLIGLAMLTNLPAGPPKNAAPTDPFVVGIQLEGPSAATVLSALDKAVASFPQVDILALSEYTFSCSIPPDVRDWCKRNKRHLVAGGLEFCKDDKSGDFENTAYVVGPEGDIVFAQCKSVPIQFFHDGKPARQRRVWVSPWGKIGICICYDLSYRRVTDDLIGQGAGAILCPAMDCMSWPKQEHVLNAVAAPIRAAEYRVPVFRVCSSGISQLVMPDGRVTASAAYPGQGEMLAGYLPVQACGSVPIDRFLGPLSTVIAGILVLGMAVLRLQQWIKKRLCKSRTRSES